MRRTDFTHCGYVSAHHIPFANGKRLSLWGRMTAAQRSIPLLPLKKAIGFQLITSFIVAGTPIKTRHFYGDIVPLTAHARLFAISIIILGITVFATSIRAIIGKTSAGRQHLSGTAQAQPVGNDHFATFFRNCFLHFDACESDDRLGPRGRPWSGLRTCHHQPRITA